MIWLEMSRDEAHGGTGWGFTECLWSPTHKKSSISWTYWSLLKQVRKNDIVVHLKGKTHKQFFVGYSTADSNGYATKERPPEPKDWSFANSFYRVPLTGFVPFLDPLPLDEVFRRSKVELREYFDDNKQKPKNSKEHLFYVFQAGRLQCLNGAYLSELSEGLSRIIFGLNIEGKTDSGSKTEYRVRTGEQVGQIMARFGQDAFSQNVRLNYGERCCFPDCTISENRLLIGAHIARWADAPDLRGETSNGLCLCLLHDKAFELGFFTLDKEFRVVINRLLMADSPWAQSNVAKFNGRSIRLGEVAPSHQALAKHWIRIGFTPQG